MFLLYLLCLQNFKKIKDQLLYYQINIKISSFYDLKLYIKNKFINWIVNNIRFEWNLIYMLRIWNLMIRFFKLTKKRDIWEVWRVSREKLFKLLIYLFFVNFKNLTVEFHVLNVYIKFRSNWILFTIRSINLFFIYNFRS